MSRMEFDRLTRDSLELSPLQHEKLRLNPELRDMYREADASVVTRLGFRIDIDQRSDDSRIRRTDYTLYFSYWPLILVTLMPWSLFLFFAWRRRRTMRQGQCPTCGYDLRATSDRCPECGTETRGINRRWPKAIAEVRTGPSDGLKQDQVVAVAFIALVGTLAVWVLYRNLLH